MAHYIDGFVLPIQHNRLNEYKRLVEAASPRLWRGLFARLATYSRRRPCPQASRLGFDAASGVMLERDSPAVEPAEGQMGNVGIFSYHYRSRV